MIQSIHQRSLNRLETLNTSTQNNLTPQFMTSIEKEETSSSKELSVEKKEVIMHRNVDITRFDPADIERWDQMIDNFDPIFLAFSSVACDSLEGMPEGTRSISFYDFCSIIESGKVINEENVSASKECYVTDNWEYTTMNTTYENGLKDTEKSSKVLSIIQKCFELGMMTKEHGLILPDELSNILTKQSYNNQQVFQSKQYMNNLVAKKDIQTIYKANSIHNSYQNSI